MDAQVDIGAFKDEVGAMFSGGSSSLGGSESSSKAVEFLSYGQAAVSKAIDVGQGKGALGEALKAKSQGFGEKYAENLALAKQFMAYGTAIGGAIGACFGGIGAPVGAAIGAVVGAIAGFIVPFFKEIGGAPPKGIYDTTNTIIDSASWNGSLWLRNASIQYLDKQCLDYGETINNQLWFACQDLVAKGILPPGFIANWMNPPQKVVNREMEIAMFCGTAQKLDDNTGPRVSFLDFSNSLCGDRADDSSLMGSSWSNLWNTDLQPDVLSYKRGRRNVMTDNLDIMSQYPAASSWLAFVANGIPDPKAAIRYMEYYNEALPVVKDAINKASTSNPYVAPPPKGTPPKPPTKAPVKSTPKTGTAPAITKTNKHYFLEMETPKAYYVLGGMLLPLVLLLVYYLYKSRQNA